MSNELILSLIEHPEYTANINDWEKWRYAYEGGRAFIDEYLETFSSRESSTDFTLRKDMTYCPAFAKAAINDIKNAIFQRLFDVTRIGGSNSYQKSISGVDFGVDLRGNSMNSYVGTKILPDLLVMGRVGIFIDMPVSVGVTQRDRGNKRPYIYTYRVEDIKAWSFDLPENPNEFTKLVLADHIYSVDPNYGLPVNVKVRYRLVTKIPEGVLVKFYDDIQQTDSEGNPSTIEYFLNLKRIPFVLFQIPESLMKDVADYQIALLNLESSDINYAQKANFPFYTEQFENRFEPMYQKAPGNQTSDGEKTTTEVARDRVTEVGISQGRRYAKGLDRPDFIHPSSEPLKISMEKGQQLKDDIRRLVNLAVINNAKMASAESKAADNQSLESGLSFIGLVLEKGEREIAAHWSAYENTATATITYPRNYSIKSEKERQDEADSKAKILEKIPSNTFKREMAKQIVNIVLGGKIADSTMEKIQKEIDLAPSMTSDPKAVVLDLENGLVSPETASKIRGYPEGEVEKAKEARAERIALTLEAQGGIGGQARGNVDGQIEQPSSSDEKQGKLKRGESTNPDVDDPTVFQ